MHYTRWRKHGSPIKTAYSARDDAKRFATHFVDSGTDDCQVWQAFCEPKMGYGMFWFEERMQYSHRVAWILSNGSVPEGQVVRHKCDNPPCVNMAHLELGSQQENMDDAVARGRTSRGESHPDARLAESDVNEMRRRRASGEQVKVLAHEFGINPGYASRLLRGLKWSHTA